MIGSASPFPLPAAHMIMPMGGREGERAGAAALKHYAAAGRRTVVTRKRFATKAASVRQALPAGLAPLTW